MEHGKSQAEWHLLWAWYLQFNSNIISNIYYTETSHLFQIVQQKCTRNSSPRRVYRCLFECNAKVSCEITCTEKEGLLEFDSNALKTV